jgi:hypothetical protein
MSEFILCDRVFNEHTLRTQCNLNINDLLDDRCKPPKRVDPHTPYLLNGTGDRNDRHIQTLLARPQARKIVELSNIYGADNVLAMSELFGSVRDALGSEPSTGGIGAATSVYAERTKGFLKAVNAHQNALIDYHNAHKSNSPTAPSAKQNATTTYQKMTSSFGVELGKIKNKGGSRGTPLTSLDRGLSIARDSRNVTKLNLTSAAQTSRLVSFTRYAKFLGNGLAVIDIGSRIGNVANTYQIGGDWHRETVAETFSFAASAGTGAAIATAGGAAITFLLVATPVGWAGLVLVTGGVLVATASAGGSMVAGDAMKSLVNSKYDEVAAFLNR